MYLALIQVRTSPRLSIPMALTLLCIIFSSFLAVSGRVLHAHIPSRRHDTASYVTSLSDCPSLPRRIIPALSVHDLRPDDFSYTLALGDSITAGVFSHGIIPSNVPLSASEWRGDSYAAGENPGSTTVPNLIKYYNPSLSGGSIGSNPTLEVCFGPLCPTGSIGWNSTVDQLNGALTGALVSNLPHEINDYLVPQVHAWGIPAGAYKYLNLQIGANDLCLVCPQILSGVRVETADEFEANIRSVLESIKASIPNTVVNIIGVLKISDLYELTLNQSYCANILPLPHNSTVQCQCLREDSSDGDAAREAMDALREEYNERLIKIVKEYQAARCSDFAVLWQPPNIPLGTYPVDALSNVDCFHPSLKTHRLVASYVWNLLPGNATERNQTFTWSEIPTLRCLEEHDRIQTSALLQGWS